MQKFNLIRREKMKRGLIILILCLMGVSIVSAKPPAKFTDVILLPTKPGVPSQILYPSSKEGADYLIRYFDPEGASILVGLNDVETLCVFFEPPCSCAILEIHQCLICYYPSSMDYWAFIADVPDGVTLDDFPPPWGPPVPPGPSPIGTLFVPPTLFEADTADFDWDTLVAPNVDTVGTNPFVGGWIKNVPDSTPNPRIGTILPLHSLIWRSAPPSGGEAGWYLSGHEFFIEVLVRVLENMPPEQDLELLTYSYTTGDREVTTHAWDIIGVPPDSHGVESVNLYYAVNYGTATPIPMTMVSGDSTDGVWAASIPGVPAYDTVSYYSVAVDYNGVADTSVTYEYVIRAGTSGNILFYNDDLYGPPYSHDAINKVLSNVDNWDVRKHPWLGIPDSSVIAHYTPGMGLGKPVIFINSWGGDMVYVDRDLLERFLDAGGSLWIISQDICCGSFYPTFPWDEWNGTLVGCFLREYCKIDSFFDDFATDSISIFYGVPGDPVSGDFAAGITVYPYDCVGPGYNYTGAVKTLGGAVNNFCYETGEISGFRYEDTYKLVFLFWPFAYITDTLAQEKLVLNIYSWFTAAIEQEKVVTHSVPCFLSQNSPNPMHAATTINYSISSPSNVSLRIYDVTGRLVKTLVKEDLKAGSYTIRWDGKGSNGKKVASGVYFYRLDADDFKATKKMIVLR